MIELICFVAVGLPVTLLAWGLVILGAWDTWSAIARRLRK